MKLRLSPDQLHPEQYPEYLLLELYRHYRSTGRLRMKVEELTEPLRQTHLTCDIAVYHQAVQMMVNRGWANYVSGGEIELSPAGLARARWLLSPWHMKMWDFLKGDLRTVIVAAITAIATAIVTALVLRLLGWR